MAKSDKSVDSGAQKSPKKALTMREKLEGATAKTEVKGPVAAKKGKKNTADITPVIEEKSFVKAFLSGFTLPIRVVLRPLRWVLKRIIPPYFKNSFKELQQVTWPSTRDTFRLTFVVLLFALIFGGLIALVDYGLDKLFKLIIIG